MTLDDKFEHFASKVPGFAGFALDESGNPVVYLTDLSKESTARSHLPTLLAETVTPELRGPFASKVAFKKADFDFRQLAGWNRTIVQKLNVAGVTLFDINELRNRVTVGVVDASSIPAVKASIAKLGIPKEAVEVVVSPRAVVETSLQDYHRPMVSALKIGFAGGGWCTFTANAFKIITRVPFVVDSVNNYLITNSHCTNSFGNVTGEGVGQPTISNGVGTEQYDPPLFTNSSDARCPPTRLCRLSDAAMFYQYDVPNENEYWAHTTAWAPLGSLNISEYKEILQTQWPENIANMTMFKIGARTGVTYGQIVETCATVPQYNPDGSDTGRSLICQYHANYASNSGDSGSPVAYFHNQGSDPRITLIGIHWGSGGWFSGWYYAEMELGNAAGVEGLKVSTW